MDLKALTEGSDTVDLSWDYPGDRGLLEGFEVWRRVPPEGAYRAVAFAGADAQSYRDRDLIPGTDYDYRLTAVNPAGVSAPLEASARTWPHSLAAPTNWKIHSRGLVVQLDWRDNAPDERGYRVERRDPGSATYRVVGRLSAGVTRFYDAVNLAEGAYHYRVRAISDEADSPWMGIGAVVSTVERKNLAYLPYGTKRR